jgi:hypothetical protein
MVYLLEGFDRAIDGGQPGVGEDVVIGVTESSPFNEILQVGVGPSTPCLQNAMFNGR